MESEIYSIDLNMESRMVLYGGGDDRCTVQSLDSGDVVAVVENFGDSVVFCRFVDGGRFVVGSLDGTVSLMTVEEEISSTSVDEDITRMRIADGRVLVGTAGGNVHVFSSDLSVQNVCIGQHNEIKDLAYEEGRVYALSETNLMVFNVSTHQKVMDLHIRGGCVFSRIPASDVICLGLEDSVVIRKSDRLIARIDMKGTPECILYMNNYFVVGGDFEGLVLINIPMGMRVFNISTGVGGVSIVRGHGMNSIAFSTYSGVVGHGDIRDGNSFKLLEGGVGTIFDLCFEGDTICVGGENGFNILDLKSINETVPQEESVDSGTSSAQ